MARGPRGQSQAQESWETGLVNETGDEILACSSCPDRPRSSGVCLLTERIETRIGDLGLLAVALLGLGGDSQRRWQGLPGHEQVGNGVGSVGSVGRVRVE